MIFTFNILSQFVWWDIVFHVLGIKTTKIDNERINLSLNPKYEIKEPRQEHKMCKTNVQTYIYCNEIKKHKPPPKKRLYNKIVFQIGVE
jgi:hypothetical protein